MDAAVCLRHLAAEEFIVDTALLATGEHGIMLCSPGGEWLVPDMIHD